MAGEVRIQTVVQLIKFGGYRQFSVSKPPLLLAAKRCTKGSLRSPSVQRGAAAPLLHEVLPTVAHRTTTVLQN